MSGQCSREYSTNKKRLSVILTESLPPPPPPTLGSFVWYAHTRGHRTHANVPCVDRQAGGAVLEGWPWLWASHARSRGGPLPALAMQGPVRAALLTTCIGKDVRGVVTRCCTASLSLCVCVCVVVACQTAPLPHVASPRAGAAVTGWVFRTENMCGPWELQERVLPRKRAGTGHGHERA